MTDEGNQVPSMTDKGDQVPLSEVGFSGPRNEETRPEREPSTGSASLLRGMEALLTQLVAANQPRQSSVPQLVKLDPDEPEAATCYACGKVGHLVSTCPNRTNGNVGNVTTKEVHACQQQHRRARGFLCTSSDTEDLYSIGFQKVCSQYGKEFTFALKCKIMGMHSKEFSKTIVEDLELPTTVEDFMAQTRQVFNELFPTSQVMSGVKKLIDHLDKHNIPMGLATSSSKETYEQKVQNHLELFDKLKYKTWGSSDPEVKRGKPYPDVFLVAASKFPDKPSPDKCLVFEDSVNGVKAACAAGMQVVMVPDPRLDRELTADATLVLSSVEDFQPEFFGLPPYQ